MLETRKSIIKSRTNSKFKVSQLCSSDVHDVQKTKDDDLTFNNSIRGACCDTLPAGGGKAFDISALSQKHRKIGSNQYQ